MYPENPSLMKDDFGIQKVFWFSICNFFQTKNEANCMSHVTKIIKRLTVQHGYKYTFNKGNIFNFGIDISNGSNNSNG